jgi:hypothetical protein
VKDPKAIGRPMCHVPSRRLSWEAALHFVHDLVSVVIVTGEWIYLERSLPLLQSRTYDTAGRRMTVTRSVSTKAGLELVLLLT